MIDYQAFRASQPGQTEVDRGPTIDEIDKELADTSQALLEIYARDFDPAQLAGRNWESLPVEIRRGMRAGNALAKRQNAKERAEKKAAEQARIDAQQTAQAEAQIAEYKQRARSAFLLHGTAAQFEAAWPMLLSDWQRVRVHEHLDAEQAAVRARVGSVL